MRLFIIGVIIILLIGANNAQRVVIENKYRNDLNILASDMDVPVIWLDAVISLETAGSNSSAITNKHTNAVGLIQFMPNTLKWLGFTTSAVKAMNKAEQLTVVRVYFSKTQNLGYYNSLTDLYLSVFYPKARTGTYDVNLKYVISRKSNRIYIQNKVLDFNKDGILTVGDIDQYLIKNYRKAYTFQNNRPIQYIGTCQSLFFQI